MTHVSSYNDVAEDGNKDHNHYQSTHNNTVSLTSELLVDFQPSQTEKESSNTNSINHIPDNPDHDNISDLGNGYSSFGRESISNHEERLAVPVQFDRSDSDSPLLDQWHCHNNDNNNNDKTARNQLIAVCTLCVMFMIGEAVGGVLSNSLALFTDVLHLASDLISFLISLLAMYLSKKPATKTMSFGFHRAEVIGALFSVFIIWLVTGVLCYMAVERIQHNHYKNVNPNEMLVTASVGVAFNIVMGIVLHSEVCCKSQGQSFGHHGHSHQRNSHHSRTEHSYTPLIDDRSDHEQEIELESQVADKPKHVHHKNINVRAAFIHVIGDIIQSVGVLIASFIIKFTEDPKYKLADPICTFIFSVLVIFTTITVLRDTLRVMMEGVPRDVCYKTVIEDLKRVEGVKSAHTLLIWSLTIDKNVMSVHLTVGPNEEQQNVLERANQMLQKKYDFRQTTIQIEKHVHNLSCSQCDLPV